MNTQKKGKPAERTLIRKILFSTIIVAIFPLLLLLLVEFFLRIINYGDNYNLFIDFPEEDFQEYRFINPEIGKKYFRVLDYNRPAADMFLKEKPENGFRIFVLGSSTALGFPYDQNLMFSRILQERLQDCYPYKKLEVINTAITAINSFTLLDYAKEILREEPDAILIYAGHNEFYGALGIGSTEKAFKSRNLTHLHLNLLSLKIYQLVSNLIKNVGSNLSGDFPNEDIRGTLMKRIAKNREIPYDSKTYILGIEYYRENMHDLIRKFKKQGIPVFLSEVCSNVKDLPPFCSMENHGDYPPASSVFQQAAQHEQKGLYNEARELYHQAKDLDCIRFRASEEINSIIHELALEHAIHLVPSKSDYFEKVSPHQLIGDNLMTEHVHPNIDGYFLLADAFFNEISRSGIMGEKPNAALYKNSFYYKRNWGYTELDSLVAHHGVNLLKTNWPFQSMESSSEDYRRNYTPFSFTDSLAFKVVTDTSTFINEAHEELAAHYLKQNEYHLAFREYYANVKYDPFQVKYYNDAIHCLTLSNDFSLALELVKRSLELKETYYARFILGEILFLKGDYSDAVKAFTRAASLDNSRQAKLQVLISLHKVYYYSGRAPEANQILSEIRKVNPDFKPEYPLEKKSYVFYLPDQVAELINEAYELYRVRDFDSALPLFLKSLDIKETSLANRCVGDILVTRDDSASLIYYQKAYPDYKNNLNFLFNLGILYTHNKLKKEAESILNEIQSLNPNYSKTHFLVTEINKLP